MHMHSISFSCEIYTLFILTVLTKSTLEQYIIEVWEPKPGGFQTVLQCDATGADFGGEIPMLNSIVNETGCTYFTVPEDCCQDTFLQKHLQNNRTGCINYYAVVPRGNCSFSEKAYHAQRSYPNPYSALIIFNNDGHAPIPMAGGKYADRVVIPVVMVSHACMRNMMDRFSTEKGYVVAIRAIPGYYDLVKYLVPLIAVVSFCFVVLCISLAVRVCRERRHLAKKRLSKRNLKKLPVKKFRKGDTEESCAICIDEFVDGEKLRVLPCNHAYHCKCIDPWLTKIRKVCPICKRKVLSSGESDSSDSDNERRDSASTSDSTAMYRENAPLLRNAEAFASGGPSAPTQTGGLRRNLQGGRRLPLRVIITSPADTPLPTSGTSYSTTNDGEIRETEGASAISSRIEAVSGTLRRALRPYYEHIVSRKIRLPWRNATRESECASGPTAERPYVVDNNAFDESTETLHVAEDLNISDQRRPEALGIFSSERIAVSEGRNCSGLIPESEAELSTSNQQDAATSEKDYTNQSAVNVSPYTGNNATPFSANLTSTVNGSTQNDLNVGDQALIRECGTAGDIQQKQD